MGVVETGTESKEKHLEAKKKLRGLFTRPNIK